MRPKKLQYDTVDSFLRKTVKEKYYADNPDSIEHLKINILNAIVEIWPHTFKQVQEILYEWGSRRQPR